MAQNPAITRLYLLTLFYPSLRQAQNEAVLARRLVESVAGTKWRVLTPGEQICAIGFESEASHEYLSSRFLTLPQLDTFHFLLVEVSKPVAGYLFGDVWTWLARHLPKDSTRK